MNNIKTLPTTLATHINDLVKTSSLKQPEIAQEVRKYLSSNGFSEKILQPTWDTSRELFFMMPLDGFVFSLVFTKSKLKNELQYNTCVCGDINNSSLSDLMNGQTLVK